MAIKLNITDDKGVITRYHRVAGLTLRPEGEITIEIESYVNKEKRDEQARTGQATFYNRTAISQNFETDELFQMIYDGLLQTETFKGGEKV